jgi:putative Holliday junction resolvase
MSSEPGRVMALDVGERRIGVALSDPTRMLASPLTTIRAVPRSTALKRILTLIRDYQVTALVVGLPLTMNGDIGPQATLVQQFVDELRPLIDIPIFFVDERLTTVAAERMMIDLKIKPEQRRAGAH